MMTTTTQSEQGGNRTATQIISIRETEVDGAECVKASVKTLGLSVTYVYELQDGKAVAAFKIVEGHRRKAMKHEFLLVAEELEEQHGYTTAFAEDEDQYRGESQ